VVGMDKRVMKYLRYFFPLLFSLYLGGIISFTHVHIENGVTIVHSHPYKNSGTDHKHTGAELQLLHQLYVIQLAGAITYTYTADIGNTHFVTLLEHVTDFVCQDPEYDANSLRGPPYLS